LDGISNKRGPGRDPTKGGGDMGGGMGRGGGGGAFFPPDPQGGNGKMGGQRDGGKGVLSIRRDGAGVAQVPGGRFWAGFAGGNRLGAAKPRGLARKGLGGGRRPGDSFPRGAGGKKAPTRLPERGGPFHPRGGVPKGKRAGIRGGASGVIVFFPQVGGKFGRAREKRIGKTGRGRKRLPFPKGLGAGGRGRVEGGKGAEGRIFPLGMANE